MLGNMKIKAKLFIGFGVVIALALVVAVASVLSMVSISKNIDDIVVIRIPQKDLLSDVTKAIYITSEHLRDALIADNAKEIENNLQQIVSNSKKATELFDKIKASLTTEKGKQLFQVIMDKRKAYADTRDKVIQLIREGKKRDAIELMQKLDPLQDAYFKSVDDLDAVVNTVAKKSGAEAQSSAKTAQMVTITLSLAAFVLAIGAALLIVKSITKPLNQAVDIANRIADGDLTVQIDVRSKDETGMLLTAMKNMTERLKEMVSGIRQASASVASGSHQLSASSEEITRTMNDQSSRSSQIATSAEEMSQTVIDIAKNSADIATSASDTATIARKGADVVNKSVDESRAIAETVESSAKVMRNLGDKSKQIGEIVSTINDIADQTNLLALNAAIEAARAGEQGRGFAVVADEVRKLAERTAHATSEISSMIGAIQGEVDNAVTAMNRTNEQVEVGLRYSQEAGEQLATIVQSVTTLQGMVQQIASATEEMSSTSEAISGDIQQIATGAREISGGSEQVAQASSELARLAGELKVIVDKFRV